MSTPPADPCPAGPCPAGPSDTAAPQAAPAPGPRPAPSTTTASVVTSATPAPAPTAIATPTAPDEGPHDRERSHLAASRAALRAMREDVQSLDIRDVTANWVNAEALRHQIDARIKALADLAHTPLFFGRLDCLHEPGGPERTPAGRTDTEARRPDTEARRTDTEAGRPEPAEAPPHAATSFYIGRRHVHDADGDPMVIDWRAPVSEAFYQASKKKPMDVVLRRRFGYTGGDLTAYEDERLDEAADPAEAARTSKLLQQEIERPRVGPMRDIVATIQPEQDEIVRSDLSGTLCVQGGPGTGKTAVGLHRVAYLLYAHRERLARTGTLVIGPNASFLHYIEQVLPALGELEVRQATVGELVGQVPVRGTDDAAAALVKGDARMAQVLRRALRSHVTMPAGPLVVVRGSRRWRIPAYEVEEIVTELLTRDIRYGAARDALPQRIAHTVLVRMEQSGEAPDDRVQDAVARNPAVKAAVKAIWPVVDPAKLVLRLLSDADFLAEHAGGLLTGDEQKTILWARPPRSTKAAAWSAADAVLVDEAADLVARTPSLGHVVLDEAQDLSPMQYRAVGRRCSTGSATVLGDLAQGTTPWATPSWDAALRHLGKADALVEELTAGFRVPREVISYASRLLPAIAPGLTAVASVRESPGSLSVRRVGGPGQPEQREQREQPEQPERDGPHGQPRPDGRTAAAAPTDAAPGGTAAPASGGRAVPPTGEPPAGELSAAVAAACAESLRREGSVGLIAADTRVAGLAAELTAAGLPYLSPGEETTDTARLTLVPASLAKGLEYDYVVLDEPAAIVDAEPDERTGLRRLYVCLTRAVSGLTILHTAPLPKQLTGTAAA